MSAGGMRTGMFRTWVVLSVVWAVGVVAIHGPALAGRWERSQAIRLETVNAPLLPVLCQYARGEEGVDYYRFNEGPGRCNYIVENFRRLYPEYSELSDDDLAERLSLAAGLPPGQSISDQAARMVGLAVVPPLLALALGWAGFWAAAGFRRRVAE